MSAPSDKQDSLYLPVFLISVILLSINVYYYCFDLFYGWGLYHPAVGEMIKGFLRTGLLKNEFAMKAVVLVFALFINIVRAGKTTDKSWKDILIRLGVSLAVFFLPKKWFGPYVYLVTSFGGYIAASTAIALVGRKWKGMQKPNQDPMETFMQGVDAPIETPFSLNFKIQFQANGKNYTKYLPIVNPFRGNIIFGLPGSGKTFSIILEYISQLIRKGFSTFVYDYKYPDLSEFTYNCYLRNKDVFKSKYGVEPYFCVVNMQDPRYSMRCNPFDPKYIHDATDASEKATVIQKNLDKYSAEHEDFFAKNAKKVWAAIILYLRKFEGGRFCTFPHFVEMTCNTDFEKVLQILSRYDETRVFIQDIYEAGKGNAQDQFQGIRASASTPLAIMATPTVYWIFSQNDVDLAINKKDRPTIMCVGNDPKRENVYKAGVSLITSEMYTQVNQDGRVPCSIIHDEIPTMNPKGFDNIVATGRSRLLAAVAAAQDMSQIIRDWGERDAKAFLNIIGNQFYGQMTGDHVRQVSELFGTEKRRQQSETSGSSSDSVSTSYHDEKRLPESKLATLSQGTFAALITDDIENQITAKHACARIIPDLSKRPNKKDGKWEKIPMVAAKAFHQEEVAQHVRENADDQCTSLIYEKKLRAQIEAHIKDPQFNMTEDGILVQEADREYKAMPAKEKAALLEETIKVRQEEEVQAVMNQRMKQIRDDIVYIMVTERMYTDNSNVPKENHINSGYDPTGGLDPGQVNPD